MQIVLALRAPPRTRLRRRTPPEGALRPQPRRPPAPSLFHVGMLVCGPSSCQPLCWLACPHHQTPAALAPRRARAHLINATTEWLLDGLWLHSTPAHTSGCPAGCKLFATRWAPLLWWAAAGAAGVVIGVCRDCEARDQCSAHIFVCWFGSSTLLVFPPSFPLRPVRFHCMPVSKVLPAGSHAPPVWTTGYQTQLGIPRVSAARAKRGA